MNKKFVTVIAIIATLSLLGVAVTQFIWVDQAINLRTRQFENTVRFETRNVLNILNDIRRDSLLAQITRGGADGKALPYDAGLDYQALLDSLIDLNIDCLEGAEYHWGLIDTASHEIVFGACGEQYRENLFNSGLGVSAALIYNGERNKLLSIYFPDQKQLVVRNMILWVLILSGVFLIIVVISFMIFIHTLIKQKKLSEMKSDFINNMTHEFKTPISTISVASEMLMRPGIQSSSEKTTRYANIIFDENLRLRNQVEQVLHMSMLEKSEFKMHIAPVDLHKLIENTVDVFNVVLREKNGMIQMDLYALNTIIDGDEVFLINVFSNLLDNAAKYSKGRPEIRIATRDAVNGIEIIVADNGIGISNENLKHIFKKFYRVHTGDRHDVKGFGLGLFYVKTIIDAHHGAIKVSSDLKKGSIFEIYLPYKTILSDHDQC